MRTCGACKHKRRHDLEIALAEHKDSYRHIAARFHLSAQCIRNHRQNHMPAALAKVEKRSIKDREGLLQRIEWNMGFVEKMRRSCDRYLQDPHNAELYDLGPRAEDVEVIYMEEDGEGKQTKKKALLSELLAEVPNLFAVKFTMTDPRELILKSARAMNETLMLLGRAMELLKAEGESQTNIQFNLVEIMPVVYHVLELHPIVLKEVQEAVRANYQS